MAGMFYRDLTKLSRRASGLLLKTSPVQALHISWDICFRPRWFVDAVREGGWPHSLSNVRYFALMSAFLAFAAVVGPTSGVGWRDPLDRMQLADRDAVLKQFGIPPAEYEATELVGRLYPGLPLVDQAVAEAAGDLTPVSVTRFLATRDQDIARFYQYTAKIESGGGKIMQTLRAGFAPLYVPVAAFVIRRLVKPNVGPKIEYRLLRYLTGYTFLMSGLFAVISNPFSTPFTLSGWFFMITQPLLLITLSFQQVKWVRLYAPTSWARAGAAVIASGVSWFVLRAIATYLVAWVAYTDLWIELAPI